MMMLQSLFAFPLSILVPLALLGTSVAASASATSLVYTFDRDAAGVHCDKATKDYSAEDFRLYCINQQASFRNCALTCSEWLHFEGTTGTCKPSRCNFYKHSFPLEEDSLVIDNGFQPSHLSMNDIARGKVVMFAFAPLWEGHAQYMYEMLEEIRALHDYNTEAFLLPIDIHDPQNTHPRFELTPFVPPVVVDASTTTKRQRVRILPEVKPHQIASHPFLTFVRSLVHKDGFPNFDVYTDRFVIFVVSHDGLTVERMVVPTFEELKSAVTKYSAPKDSMLQSPKIM